MQSSKNIYTDTGIGTGPAYILVNFAFGLQIKDGEKWSLATVSNIYHKPKTLERWTCKVNLYNAGMEKLSFLEKVLGF